MRRWWPALLLALASSACAASPPRGGAAPRGAAVDHDLDPTDVFPADLDLVVRIDLGRMRDGIGPAAAADLAKRALATDDGANGELADALACAQVVWIAAHAAEMETGDRVIAVEGNKCMPDLAEARWKRKGWRNKQVRIFDRRSDAHRAGTARIMNLGNKATIFVSPVELDAVKRVLDRGPDAGRGNPSADGVVSLDLRARPLPPALAKKYPSIAAVLGGIERVRGSAKLGDLGLEIDVELLGKTTGGAKAASRFLEALRDSLSQGTRFAEATKTARVELVERTVEVKLALPPKLVLGLLSGSSP